MYFYEPTCKTGIKISIQIGNKYIYLLYIIDYSYIIINIIYIYTFIYTYKYMKETVILNSAAWVNDFENIFE